jgi:hypothetical protein
MKVLVLVVLALIGLLVWKLTRGPGGKPNHRAKPAAAAKKRKLSNQAVAAMASRYRAVSIDCGPGACEAAKSIGGKRVLVGELGNLPLKECDAAVCECKYVHHDDRRDEHEDKRAISALSTQLYQASGKTERRKRKGRRRSDFE